MSKKGIVIGSFGTSYEDTRIKNLEGLEKHIQQEFPEELLVHAFTSTMIRGILEKRGTPVFSVTQALEELKKQQVTEVTVQATHLLTGIEYEKLVKETEAFQKEFQSLNIGAPLLSTKKDIEKVADFFNGEFPREPGFAVVLMGHGSSHEANELYTSFQEICKEKGYVQLVLGTVEAVPDLDDVIWELKGKGIQRLLLTPLMLVAGDHATNDMASDEEDSWKTLLTKEGFEVEVLLKGLGEYPEIRQIYIDHIHSALPVGC